MDRKELFGILNEYNYWNRDIEEDFVERNFYVDQLEKILSGRGIAVIQGPRRSGKTVLMKLLIRRLIERDPENRMRTLYVNLEDFRFSGDMEPNLLQDMIDTFRSHIRFEGTIHFFLDEIQNIPDFERFLRTKYDTDREIKFIISGSNSSLLSKELGTLLTGRTATLRLYPFSFTEYLKYNDIDLKVSTYHKMELNRDRIVHFYEKYKKFGGIPEFFGIDDPYSRLREYVENILFRDIAERFDVRNFRLLKELTNFLILNSSNRFSSNRLSGDLSVSRITINEYVSYLEQAFLIFIVQRYSRSMKKRMRGSSKVYTLDSGIFNSLRLRTSEDIGRMLENIVLVHLLRSGNEVYYHSDAESHQECDFIVKRGLEITDAIQVSQRIDDKRTFKRELSGLISALKEYELEEGLMLTENEYRDLEVEGSRIKIRPIWYWLLETEPNGQSSSDEN